MPLYLITGTLLSTPYGGDTTKSKATRIVGATDADEAEAKFIEALTVDDRYGTSVEVVVDEVNPSIE